MVVGMAWIVGVFALGAASIHLSNWLSTGNNRNGTTYAALVTLNNELQVEWYLRSFLFFSWLRGRSIQIILWDQGSTDATMAIVGKMAETNENIQTATTPDGWAAFIGEHREDAVILLYLNKRSAVEHCFIPYW